MTRRHTGFRGFLESLQEQDLTKISKKKHIKKGVNITKMRGWGGKGQESNSSVQVKTKIDY